MVTVNNYKDDKYYPKVVRAFDAILSRGELVAPIDVFIEIGNLKKERLEDWRFGRIPFLERVIEGNLSKCNRILRIIGFHAHDLDMVPTETVYKKWGKGRKVRLRFSRSGSPQIERAYSRCFRWNRKLSFQEWKKAIGPLDRSRACFLPTQQAGINRSQSSIDTPHSTSSIPAPKRSVSGRGRGWG